MAAAMYPGGGEDDSDAGTDHSEERFDEVVSSDALYDAGLYGGARRSCLGPSKGAGLDPEEEQNFRREARRAARSRPVEKLKFTQSMEDLIKTFPLLLAEENETEEERESRRLKEMRQRRRVSPGKSCRKPTNLAMSGEEKESLRKTQSERVKGWLSAGQ